MRELPCQVLVIGAGPAGMAAAVAAAERKQNVLVLDENPAAGGQIWRRGVHAPLLAAQRWFDRLESQSPNAVLRAGTSVHEIDAAARTLWAIDAEGVFRCRYEHLILATGARERFLPFPGWTLPGVLGAGGLQALAKSGYEVAGQRIGIAGSGPLLLAVAAWLQDHGAKVSFVAEQAPLSKLSLFAAKLVTKPKKLKQLAALRWKLRGVPQFYSSWPRRAHGRERVEMIELATPRGVRGFAVDALGVGFGLVPETGLAERLGCALDAHGAVCCDAWQRTTIASIYVAGEPTGIAGVDSALLQGELAGAHAAGDTAHAERLRPRRDREQRFAHALEATFALREELRSMPEDDTVVCRCEDARWGAVRHFDSMRAAKLQTRCGMGPCQGRVCQPALRFLRTSDADRSRPPFLPLDLGALCAISADRKQLSSEAQS